MLNLNCKNVQHVKIYLPCNFEVNPITHFGVVAFFFIKFSKFLYFSSFISKTMTFRTILRPVKNGVNVLIKKSRISVL